MLPQDLIQRFCYENGVLKAKDECRAALINYLILEDERLIDIDDAENEVDKTLRELNLWNEPTLADLLKEDDGEVVSS